MTLYVHIRHNNELYSYVSSAFSLFYLFSLNWKYRITRIETDTN